MKELEGTKLVIVKHSSDGNLELIELLDNSIATRVSVSALIPVMKSKLNLTDGEYDIYVKVPSDKTLQSLNLGSLESVALLPVEAGPFFTPGRKAEK